jgi:hypothetical protein
VLVVFSPRLRVERNFTSENVCPRTSAKSDRPTIVKMGRTARVEIGLDFDDAAFKSNGRSPFLVPDKEGIFAVCRRVPPPLYRAAALYGRTLHFMMASLCNWLNVGDQIGVETRVGIAFLPARRIPNLQGTVGDIG